MKKKSPVLWFEPIVFLFFGVFHLHRIWGLVSRESYARFWTSIMNDKGTVYYSLMSILAIMCIAGLVVFIKNIGQNYWWRWIYFLGGGYVLFDVIAILTNLKVWRNLLLNMFDVTNPYWNLIWGWFILIGFMSLILGIAILKKNN